MKPRCASRLLVTLLCLIACCAAADDLTTRTFVLEPGPTSSGRFIQNRVEEIRFKKEPEFKNEQVFRRALRLAHLGRDYMGFVYDPSTCDVYLDRNVDLDLTNDGPPVRLGTGGSHGSAVVMEITSGSLTFPVTLTLYPYDRPDLYGYIRAQVESGWTGTLDVEGMRVNVEVVPNLDPQDPNPFSWNFAVAPSRDFLAWPEPPSTMVFGGKLFRLSSEMISSGGLVVRTTLAPFSEPTSTFWLGSKLRLLGLTRSGEPNSPRVDRLVAFAPANRFPIPPGSYYASHILTQQGFLGYDYMSTAQQNPDVPFQAGDKIKLKVSAEMHGREVWIMANFDDSRLTFTPVDQNRKIKLRILENGNQWDSALLSYG